jgi:protein-L-isoaspartate(D-aspartate) O-methyltransferase
MRRWALLLAVPLLTWACSSGTTEVPTTVAPTTVAAPSTPATTSAAAPSTTTEPAPVTTLGTADDPFAENREQMVSGQIEGRGFDDSAVLAAMRTTPRHGFVPDEYVGQAYEDHPLPIGYGQTISQPYVVAIMSAALDVEPGDRVLEVGTGSGYQAAVLADMGLEVYTIEIVPELAAEAAARLVDLGYDEITTLAADGYWGWPEYAPFDAIIVTAAPDHVPQPLVAELAPGGRMVIPVGPVGAIQTLWSFIVDDEGELLAENLGGVSFVPLTRAED